uniref:Uncharacterized protein n=1 Tax=Inoviridae sp. ctwVE22 TaxID=2825786 RepID=A0A8S5U0D6_9VIRU|nr:MAG TPA: hypothetical protein [Inoviridae sp. ctwVE22]
MNRRPLPPQTQIENFRIITAVFCLNIGGFIVHRNITKSLVC